MVNPSTPATTDASRARIPPSLVSRCHRATTAWIRRRIFGLRCSRWRLTAQFREDSALSLPSPDMLGQTTRRKGFRALNPRTHSRPLSLLSPPLPAGGEGGCMPGEGRDSWRNRTPRAFGRELCPRTAFASPDRGRPRPQHPRRAGRREMVEMAPQGRPRCGWGHPRSGDAVDGEGARRTGEEDVRLRPRCAERNPGWRVLRHPAAAWL